MIKYSFTKMNGAGNDFIMFDLDKVKLPDLTPKRIRQICDRKFGIGADGVITIRQTENNKFSMIYYNADGSTGTLCGNGARCAVRFAHLTGKFVGEKVEFSANNIIYHAEISDNTVCFWLQPVTKIKTFIALEAMQKKIIAHYAFTGSPHIMVMVDTPEAAGNNTAFTESLVDLDVDSYGRLLRHASGFPEGVNVNFVSLKNNQIHIRTFERGVEAETLACGTGSVASAVISHSLGLIQSPVTLVTRSGKLLQVGFSTVAGGYKEVTLTGPADVNFTGEIEIN